MSIKGYAVRPIEGCDTHVELTCEGAPTGIRIRSYLLAGPPLFSTSKVLELAVSLYEADLENGGVR